MKKEDNNSMIKWVKAKNSLDNEKTYYINLLRLIEKEQEETPSSPRVSRLLETMKLSVLEACIETVSQEKKLFEAAYNEQDRKVSEIYETAERVEEEKK